MYHHFFPVGYHNMCRFYGGFAYSHPVLKDFDYFWRLDSNVRYLCVPPYDPAQYVADNDLDYGTRPYSESTSIDIDARVCQDSYMPSLMLK
jgi:hypothetical protein